MRFNVRYGPFRDVLETVILALIVFLLAREAVQNFQVEGASMEPTLANDQFVLVNKLVYTEVHLGPFDFLIPGKSNGDFIFGGPKRGDVVVFRAPIDQSRDFVKRIVALPGDVVEIADGRVIVNGRILDEDEYISARPSSTLAPLTVPPDHYYVLGDNRNGSQDSRSFGPVHKDLLIGKILFRWFPLDQIGSGGNRDLRALDGTVVP